MDKQFRDDVLRLLSGQNLPTMAEVDQVIDDYIKRDYRSPFVVIGRGYQRVIDKDGVVQIVSIP